MSETLAFTLGAVGAAIVGVGICWLAAVVERHQKARCPECGRRGYDPSRRVWFHSDLSCGTCGRSY